MQANLHHYQRVRVVSMAWKAHDDAQYKNDITNRSHHFERESLLDEYQSVLGLRRRCGKKTRNLNGAGLLAATVITVEAVVHCHVVRNFRS